MKCERCRESAQGRIFVVWIWVLAREFCYSWIPSVYLLAQLGRDFALDELNGHPRQLRGANFTLDVLISPKGWIVTANTLIRSDGQCPQTQLVCENLFRSGIEV
jgi:hypothetical protein